MSRKKRYIENLTADQVSALENGFKYGKTHHYRSRCQCILLSYSGKSVPELCEFYQKSHLTIYNWFNRWESEGLSGLEIRSGRGRKRKLDFDNSDHVKLVQQSLRLENRNKKPFMFHAGRYVVLYEFLISENSERIIFFDSNTKKLISFILFMFWYVVFLFLF